MEVEKKIHEIKIYKRRGTVAPLNPGKQRQAGLNEFKANLITY